MRARRLGTSAGGVAPIGAIALIATLSFGGCGGGPDDAGGGAAADSPPGAPAAAAGGDDQLVADVSEYTLTMDRMDRYFNAMRNMALALRNVPEDQREDVMDASDVGSIDEYAARLESNPAVRDAIEKADLSPREFGLITLAYLQAGMATAVLGMRPNDDQDSLAREMRTNMDNIRFIQEHQAELESKMQRMQAEMNTNQLP